MFSTHVPGCLQERGWYGWVPSSGWVGAPTPPPPPPQFMVIFAIVMVVSHLPFAPFSLRTLG